MIKGWLSHRSTNLLYKVVYFVVFWLFKLFYRHKIYGTEHFYPGAAILAANHVSFLDPPILSISAPQEVHFLARQTLFNNPLFAALIRNLNAHPISGKAQDIGVFKMIVSILKEGKKVIMFPEGKRSANGQMQSIKPGISLLISRTKGAVIPAYIHGTYEIWPRNRKWPKLRGRTACVFGSPIFFEAAESDKKIAQDLIAKQIEDAILSLKTWYEEGAKGSPP
jgi:1-acyl-sn-glycerol-3-phosphate acyltransferase